MQKVGKNEVCRRRLFLYIQFSGRGRGGTEEELFIQSYGKFVCANLLPASLCRERERERRGRIGLSINTASKG